MRRGTIFTPIIVLLLAAHSVHAQPGSLDESFGDGGKVITQVNGDDDCVRNLHILDDNSILAVGDHSYTQLFILKYRPDGSFDSSFGENGKALSRFVDFRSTQVNMSALTKNGSILISGRIVTRDASSDNMIFKILPTGLIDSSFGSNGLVLDSSFNSYDNSIAIQEDGKILTAGGDKDVVVQRYFPDGKVDSSFAVNGTAYIEKFAYNHDMILGNDGSILLCGGEYTKGDAGFTNFYVLKLHNNGTIDSSFGINGYAQTDFVGDWDEASSLLEQPDGKILVGGWGDFPKSGPGDHADANYCIARFLPDGKEDHSFGTDGKVFTDFNNSNESIQKLALQVDGKILASGSVYDSLYLFFTVRYFPDGSVDSSFGTNGRVLTDFNKPFNKAYAMEVAHDGKIVIGGNAGPVPTCAALARYNSETVLPVNLTAFTATKKENTSLLQWRTCNDINAKGFSIERSNDNKNFTAIGFVPTKGGGNDCNNYSFTDNTPLTGSNYYRLQLRDKDGKYSYSDIRSLSFLVSSLIKISPNPVQQILKIEGLDAMKQYELRIMNTTGKVIASVKTNQTLYNWNVQALPPGMYYLVAVDSEGEKQVVKFVKE